MRRLPPILLLLVLVGSAGCESSGAQSGNVVPWLNQPLRLYSIPDPKLVVYPTSAPPCRGEQLRVSRGRTAVGLGNQLEELEFRNIGASPCLLRGYPTIRGEAPTGRRERLHAQHDGTYFGQLLPADLTAGGHVFLDLATSSGCDGGRKPVVRYRHLLFSLPEGGSVRAGGVSIREVCGLSMSEFGLPQLYSQPRAAVGTPGTLRARLQLPATVRAGTTLRYIVTLSNPTGSTVVLSPCPGYSEGLYGSRVTLRRSFALSCRSAHAIPAHKSVRYVMRLAVPLRARNAVAKIGWNLNTPNGPFTAGALDVTAG